VILAMLPDTAERYLSTPLFAGIPPEMNAAEQELFDSTALFLSALFLVLNIIHHRASFHYCAELLCVRWSPAQIQCNTDLKAANTDNINPDTHLLHCDSRVLLLRTVTYNTLTGGPDSK
jgi:hypothetical protein